MFKQHLARLSLIFLVKQALTLVRKVKQPLATLLFFLWRYHMLNLQGLSIGTLGIGKYVKL